MVNNCANPKCNKPLHYLRDGRVFVFDVASARVGADGKRMRHLEHFWLCGDCAPLMTVERGAENGIVIRAKQVQRPPVRPAALAS
ncbi:hypothetical protein [Acidipila sp. EB88]|uniref:hypothetical protein n=1 Tax=Acidipila sp. EB88 TaxID=2305226 RepID=UPI000F5FA23C|nr:hypothetical protein [Acidipila sp. EB88]RRA47771.1 hypothetical protein D1Y84_05170 [Acidipila sp. EB88]